MFRFGLMAACISAAMIGCSQKAAEKLAETAIENAAKADGMDLDVDVDGSDGAMTITSANGDVNYTADGETGSMEIKTPEGSMVAGENAKIPDNFPEDVPLYEGFNPEVVQQTAANGGFTVVGKVTASTSDVQSYYEKAAVDEGWTQKTSMVQPPMMMLVYQKEQRILQVNASEANGTTTVSITTVTQ